MFQLRAGWTQVTNSYQDLTIDYSWTGSVVTMRQKVYNSTKLWAHSPLEDAAVVLN